MEQLYYQYLRSRYILSGSRTINDMISKLEKVTKDLREMSKDGVWLGEEVVLDDCATLYTNQQHTANKFGFEEEDLEDFDWQEIESEDDI